MISDSGDLCLISLKYLNLKVKIIHNRAGLDQEMEAGKTVWFRRRNEPSQPHLPRFHLPPHQILQRFTPPDEIMFPLVYQHFGGPEP